MDRTMDAININGCCCCCSTYERAPGPLRSTDMDSCKLNRRSWSARGELAGC